MFYVVLTILSVSSAREDYNMQAFQQGSTNTSVEYE